MTDLTGRIAAVDTLPLGGTLAIEALAGSTLLHLEDTADFDEDGGMVLVGDTELLAYSSCDDDAGTLVLVEPTAALWEVDTRVELWDVTANGLVVETIAQVLAEGMEQSGDSLVATVDHALIPLLPTGMRDPDPETGLIGEAVSLTWRGDELFVTDVLGQRPMFDGTVIDPDTLPPTYVPTPEVPDEVAAPTVLGGVGALYVRWGAILHPNPVVYEVHVSDVTPIIPSSETLVQEVSGTAATVKRLPKPDEVGSPDTALRYDTMYYVAVRAKDSVDESFMSGLSAEATASPVQVNSEDIAASSVSAEHIIAGSVNAESLAAEIALLSRIKTAETGQRVEFDTDGIRLHGPEDNILIDLPTAPGAHPTFKGQVQAESLTVRGGTTFFSVLNEFAREAVINLAEQVAGPASAPVADVGWDGVVLERDERSGSLGTFKLSPSDIIGVGRDFRSGNQRVMIFQERASGTRIWYYTMAGQLTGPEFEDWMGWEITGGYKTDTANVWLGRKASDQEWYFRRTNGTYARYPATNPNTRSCMSWNGEDVLVSEKIGAPVRAYRFRRMNVSGSEATVIENLNTPDNSPTPNTAAITFIYKGTADFGTTRWVVGQEDNNSFRVFGTGGTHVPEHNWSTPAITAGGFWDDATGRFYTVGKDGVMYKHATTTWTDDALDTWYMGQSFRDNNATGGVHETSLGAITSFQMKKRARVRLTLADVPFDGGPDDPNGWRVYGKRGTPPAADLSDMKYQGSGTYAQNTFLMDAVPSTGGSSALLDGTFPGGTPAKLRSGRTMPGDPSKPIIELRGDGAARFGTLEVSNAGVVTDSTDTGWVSIPTSLGSPWTSTFKLRRIGNEVWGKGDIHPNSTIWGAINNPQTLVAALDPRFVPTDTAPFLLSATIPASAQVAFRVTVQSNGAVVGRCNATNYNGGVNLQIHYRTD